MKRQMTPRQALVRLEEQCAISEQCTYDLQQKLYRWNIAKPVADKIITRLVDNRFVDDQRYAMAYTREKYLFSKWGRHKIATGLYAKRIPKNIIDDSLDSIDNRQYALIAFKVIAGKLRMLPNDMPRFDKKQRLLRFGISRGYETSLIIKILESNRLWKSCE